MLHKMGKWLRAAGYDTTIASEVEEDVSILKRAKAEDRFLITRDRHFLNFVKHQEIIIYLTSNHLEECVKELSSKLKINWLNAPFSRCLICNTALVDEKDDLRGVPEDAAFDHKKFWRCPTCNRIYWEGSHTNQMLKQLNRWEKTYQ